MRNLIKYCRRRMKIRRIEKALNIKLYKWQKQYICGRCSWIYGEQRQTGRTTAYILRLLIDVNSPPLVIYENPSRYADSYENGYPRSGGGYVYTRFFIGELHRINKILNSAGIKTRTIYKDRKELTK